MAAFSHHYYHPFLVDSASAACFIKMSSLENEPLQPHINTSTTLHQETSFSVTETSSVDQSSKITISDTEISEVKNLQSPETSMVENGEQVSQKMAPVEKKRRFRNGSSSLSSPLSKESKGGSKKQKKGNGGVQEEDKPKEEKKGKKKGSEDPPTGYIHVRARRGQATDSHSLAERVRREKISERMNMLQQLVPGCDKVTGKALVLEEIINYVQSLQHQVEFLSMKLASVNPMLFDMAMDIDTLSVRPEQNIQKINSLASTPPLPCVPLCSPNKATTFADDTATLNPSTSFPTVNHDYLLDYPSSDFLQGQRPNLFYEHTGGPFWDAEDQRQKFHNPYGCGNNSCSLN